MARHKRQTRRQLRIFGIAFGLGLSALGGLLYFWRGNTAVPPYLWAIAGIIWILALIAPRALKPVEKVMATIFRAVTVALTTVLLTIFYFLVMTPIGLIMRVTRKDFLGKRFAKEKESYWFTVPEDGPWSRPEKPF